ncbi:polyketide-type polyunsaturated fatty acid synthase PfaA [Gordonia polyisoprenivorans VH2]|uniref:Polyketide-type polyunsaturated fatty acid synthase PfaA n=1 Tax=Gordonia polyisoprenivorans (strain DSM 44266 / VH2) TaxID=1112204 RepID=H6N3Z4_GORPV|nr:type I polyketide synthase [Gordonia polyisoprenivorans]AFA74817.1 polyketide-type polyunsaturated fatty acid synthase PfaA [Gordonia polyisoprenivorans VH2]
MTTVPSADVGAPTGADTDRHVQRRLARNPIAIVGMSGLLPQAADLGQYWQNIVDGVDCTTEVPDSRWSLDDYFDADPSAPDKTYSRRGAFLPDVAFDPLEFGLPPNQLEVTSTMQTLSLGVARDLLLDAGAPGSEWYDPSRTGVVLGTTGPVPLMHPLAARLSTPVLKEVARSCGISDDDADRLAEKFTAAFAPWEENSFPGLLANVVAGRIANRLGLGGMNCTVDAACAASLAAIRTAVAELVDGRADTMITGGVDTENSIFIYMCFSKVGALSKTDAIKPFSDNADGTLLGEGITMLALRRLSDAQRDGNRIYAVIRGLGSSSDGRSKSIYAPRAEGQLVALRRAYADAECSPTSVELFEAHATGTAVGDRTELTALGELLADGSETRFAAVGSVKSQIGHTKGAAGTASVMKLALGLHHRVLPGTINVAAPNAAITAESPYYVNTRTRPWIRDPQRPVRRAAASAMGFGGTNFHVVLEEAPGSPGATRPLHSVARAHLWHAPDVATLIDRVRTESPVDGDVPADEVRVGFVSSDDANAEYLREVAVEQLIAQPGASSWRHPEGIYYAAAAMPDLRVAALFAGQGSQYVDMGITAALNVPTLARAFDDANAVFAGASTRLGSVVYPPPAFTDEDREAQEIMLRRTEFAQPAIGALAAGQFRFMAELGLAVTDFAGHSFGELTALWASGSLSDNDFHALARARGAAMAPSGDGDRGTMLAVPADRDRVEEMLDGRDDIWLCNHNAPDQVVVGGGTDAVERFAADARDAGLNVRQLPVSAAFHTPYVDHAVDAFRPAAEAATISAPHGVVYANSPGAHYGDDIERNRDTLVGQLRRPVEFAAALSAMAEAGCNVFVEFGPKKVLTSLVDRTLDDVVAIPTDAGPLGDSDVALKRAAVHLAVLGAPLTDINRYASDPVAPRPSTGMTVTLSAPEYVPAVRKQAYQDALHDGFRIGAQSTAAQSTAAQSTAAQSTAAQSTAAQSAAAQSTAGRPNGTAVDVSSQAPPIAATTLAQPTESDMTMEIPSAPDVTVSPTRPAAEKVAAPAGDLGALLADHLHTHRGYLEGQLTLARELAQAVAQPHADPATLAAIGAVSTHGIAISEGHIRASEVIAEIVALDQGAAPTVPMRTSPAPSMDIMREEPSPAALAPSAVKPAVSQAQGHLTTVAQAVGSPVDVEEASPERTSPEPTSPEQAAEQSAVTADDVRSALREVVAERTGYPVDMVDPSMDLEADLGVDSIKRVQVLGEVQARFPQLPSLGPEQLGTARSLDQIVALLAVDPATAPAPDHPVPTPPMAQEHSAVQTAVTADDVRSALREVVAERTGYPVDMVDPSMDLEADLGVDSIKRVQVLGEVQARFPQLPSLGPEQLGTARSLDQIVALLTTGGDADPKGEAPRDGAPTSDPAVRRHFIATAELPPIDRAVRPFGDQPVAVVLGIGVFDDRAQAIAEALRADGWRVAESTRPVVDATDAPDHSGAPSDGSVVPEPMDLCVMVLPTGTDEDASAMGGLAETAARLEEAILAAGTVAKGLVTRAEHTGRRAGLVTVTAVDGHLGLAPADVLRDCGPLPDAVSASAAGVGGLVKTVAAEHPALFARALDVDERLDAQGCARHVLAEITDGATDVVEVGIDAAGRRRTLVPHRGHHRHSSTPIAENPEVDQLTADDVVVVTGGARGITALCVEALAERCDARFVLLGRTPLADEPEWARGVADTGLRAAAIAAMASSRPTPAEIGRSCAAVLAGREIAALLRRLGTDGPSPRVRYVSADIADAESVSAALAPLRAEITAVVHGAGVLADAPLMSKTRDQIRSVFAPKLLGLGALLDALSADADDSPLRSLVLFTSVAGLYGNAGQADYAVANEALVRFAARWKARHPDRHVTAIDWGAWDAGMVDETLRAHFVARGVILLPPEVGVRAFTEQYGHHRRDDTAVLIGEDTSLCPTIEPERSVEVVRSLAELARQPVLMAHRIGAHPVLPATFAIGAMIGVAERSAPGRTIRRVEGFEVLRGIVFDDAPLEAPNVEIVPAQGRLVASITTAADRGPVPRYRAHLLDSAPGPDRSVVALPDDFGTGASGNELYCDAVQFHGPSLQGMRQIWRPSPDTVIVECSRPQPVDPKDDSVIIDAYRGALHDPVLADLVLQVPPVLGHQLRGGAWLPLGVGAWTHLHPLPDTDPFLVVAGHPRVADTQVICDVTVYDTAHTMLAHLGDVTVVTTADLSDKFSDSVRQWNP